MLAALNDTTNNAHINAKDWPKDGKSLSGRLRQLAPLLRAKGINPEKLQRTSARRGWKLTSLKAAEGKRDPASSKSLASLPKPGKGMGGENNCIGVVTGNPVNINGSDADDGDDGKSAQLSDRDAVPAIGDRKPALTVLSDTDAIHEELRERGEFSAQSPAGQHRQRIRLHLTPDARSAPDQGRAGVRKHSKRDACRST